jgi:diguanylate cyclase (GGDEF)-like protein/PAS domain S-box-containing protein
MNRRGFSLTKKATLSVAVILLPVLVTFFYGYTNGKRRLSERLLNDISAIARAHEGQVYQFLEMSKRRAEDLSSDGLIRDEARRVLDGASKVALSGYLARNKLPLDRDVRAIHFIGPSGRVLASTDAASVGGDMSGYGLILDAGKPSVREARIEDTRETRQTIIAAYAPLTDRATGRPLGLIATFISLSGIEKVLTGASAGPPVTPPRPGRHAGAMDVYMVNRDRLMISPPRTLKGEPWGQTVDTTPVAACLDSGRATTGFYTGYRGAEVAGASICIPNMRWVLIVEADAGEAMAPIAAIRRSAVLAAFVVAGLLSLLLALFYRYIVLRIARVAGAAKAVAGGDYDVPIPVESGDELGVLTESFNAMASEIKERTHRLAESSERYASLISNIPDVTWTADGAKRTLFMSPNSLRVWGYTPDEAYSNGALWSESVHPEDRARVISAFEALFAGAGTFDAEYRLRRKDGRSIWVRDRAFSTYVRPGNGPAADGIMSDITEHRKAEDALRARDEQLRKAQAIAHVGSWDWDIERGRLDCSEETYRIFGVDPLDRGAIYPVFWDAVHPDDKGRVAESMNTALSGEGPLSPHSPYSPCSPCSIDHRITLPDNTVRTVHQEADVYRDASGRAVRMVGTIQDLTEARKAEFELKKLSMAIEQSVNMVFITNSRGVIEYVNPMFEKVTGFAGVEAVGQTPRILSSGETPNVRYEELWSTILSGRTYRGVHKNRKKTGGHYWCNCIISPIRDEKGEITHFLSVQEDITEKMRSEERIEHLARYDGLTGLINRVRFLDLIAEWMDGPGALGAAGALLIVDMDQFKFLNDTWGHATGDEFLRRAAKVLADAAKGASAALPARPADGPMVARLGGDEFAVFLPSADEARCMDLAERLRAAIAGFSFAEASISLTASIGAAMYPEHGRDPSTLFTRADAAVYRAKETGRNRCHFYRPEDHDLEKMHSRLAWKERILRALREDRFEPWFQPILDLRDGSVHHYEALARMRDEAGGVLLPGAFIDIAEKFGLVTSIDRMIVEKTLLVQSETRRQGKDIYFDVNLSGKDLGDEDFMAFIAATITKTEADPSRLIFEITETAAISDIALAAGFIKALKSLGCRFSLDDFGVGFTSFVYLKELGVDFIKIDGSFVKRLHESPDDQLFVKAMAEVARGLGIKSVAEFVEREDTVELLKKFGVDYAQGYLIGKPSPALGLKPGALSSLDAATVPDVPKGG